MKLSAVLPVLALSLAFGAGSASAAEQAAKEFKSPVLTRAQVDALLAKPDQVVLVDLRRPDEHSSKGAFLVFLSIQSADLEKYLAFIPRDRQVLTVSNHASRAGKAADLLASKGFKVAGAVGAELYAEEGGKVNKIQAPPPKDAAAPREGRCQGQALNRRRTIQMRSGSSDSAARVVVVAGRDESGIA